MKGVRLLKNKKPKTVTEVAEMKKEWYKTGWGIVVIILSLPFFTIWWIWAKTEMNKKTKWVLTGLISLFVIIVIVSGGNSPTTTTTSSNNSVKTNTPTQKAAEPVDRCVAVHDNVKANIESGLNITGGGSIRNLSAVKSNNFKNVYFVSGDLQGSGLEGSNDIATFNTNDIGASSAIVNSTNGVAEEFSVFPTVKDITMNDDGVRESIACALK